MLILILLIIVIKLQKTVKNIMKYVNKICDGALERNFQVKNYTSEKSGWLLLFFLKIKKLRLLTNF